MAIARQWSGIAWKFVPIAVWTGSAWENRVHFYDGTAWIELFPVQPDGTVTLSGETITDNVAINRNARAVLVVRAAGFVDKIENVTTTQIDGATDWIDPNGDATEFFEVKYDLISGDALDPSTSLADGVWGSLGADQFFEQRATFSPAQNKESTITVSLRFFGGSVLSSDTYILEAEAISI